MTVIFDLDETLIHCNESLTQPYDVLLTIKFGKKQSVDVNFQFTI